MSVFDEEMDPYDDEDEDEYISEGDEWTVSVWLFCHVCILLSLLLFVDFARRFGR